MPSRVLRGRNGIGIAASGKRGPFHKTTDWELKPSLKYDALCLLNALSGDPYYLEYYRAEYEHFHPLFTPEENSAFERLKHVIKDQGNDIISAKLALYYSVVDDETIPEMIRTAHDSSTMKIELQKTAYWSDEGWKNYEEAQARAGGGVEGAAACWFRRVLGTNRKTEDRETHRGACP